jgi:hypothetical protein
MIEFLLLLILLAMLFFAYQLRKLPWYLSEYEGIQVKIWKELMDVNHRYEAKAINSNRIYENREKDRQKIFEINNKLTEIIKLNEKLIDIYCKTRPEGRLREISELLRSADQK